MPARHVIGLTGNIASGKSAVSTILAELGAEVIDADKVAHAVLDRGTEELAAVAARFGPAVLTADGSLDRPALGRIVFADSQALADLEGIVHPGVRRRIRERLDRTSAEVVVLEAIKLLEGPLVQWVTTVWVVTAPREVRIASLVSDRAMSREDAEARVEAQNPEADKIARADVVLVNDGPLPALRQQVEEAWLRLIQPQAAHLSS